MSNGLTIKIFFRVVFMKKGPAVKSIKEKSLFLLS